VQLGALLELDEELAAVLGVDVDVGAVLALEASRVLLGRLDGLEVVLDLDLLCEALALRVVAVKDFRLCESENVSESLARSLNEIDAPMRRMPVCARMCFSYAALTSLSSSGSFVLASTHPT
jgi:hypothetical protein